MTKRSPHFSPHIANVDGKLKSCGVSIFGKNYQQIADLAVMGSETQLSHPLNFAGNLFSSASLQRCGPFTMSAIVCIVVSDSIIRFESIHARPIQLHLAKARDTASSTIVFQRLVESIRPIKEAAVHDLSKGDFVYLDPLAMVRISAAPGQPDESGIAISVRWVQFGDCSAPCEPGVNESIYPACLSKDDETTATLSDLGSTMEIHLLQHLFQLPHITDFLLNVEDRRVRRPTANLDVAKALSIVRRKPAGIDYVETESIRQTLLHAAGFERDPYFRTLSLWTLYEFIDRFRTMPNMYTDEIIKLDYSASQSIRSPNMNFIKEAFCLMATNFPQPIPIFQRSISKSELLAAVSSCDGDDLQPSFYDDIMTVHPLTFVFESIDKNIYSSPCQQDMASVDEAGSSTTSVCFCRHDCEDDLFSTAPPMCSVVGSELWCWHDICGVSQEGTSRKICSNTPQLRKEFRVRVGYSGIPALANSLYVLDTCNPGDFIGEYCGEISYETLGDTRDQYVIQVDCRNIEGYSSNTLYLSALTKGNIWRFANHSHNANCFLIARFLKGRLRVMIRAKRTLLPGMTVTIDYKDRFNLPKCFCGSCFCVETSEVRVFRENFCCVHTNDTSNYQMQTRGGQKTPGGGQPKRPKPSKATPSTTTAPPKVPPPAPTPAPPTVPPPTVPPPGPLPSTLEGAGELPLTPQSQQRPTSRRRREPKSKGSPAEEKEEIGGGGAALQAPDDHAGPDTSTVPAISPRRADKSRRKKDTAEEKEEIGGGAALQAPDDLRRDRRGVLHCCCQRTICKGDPSKDSMGLLCGKTKKPIFLACVGEPSSSSSCTPYCVTCFSQRK